MLRRSFLSASLVLPALALSPAALAQQGELEERANMALSLAESELTRVAVQGEVGEPLLAALELHGQPVALQLAPHSVRAEGFQLLEQRADGSLVPVDPGPVTTYRGQLAGLPDSDVAAALLGDGLHARIRVSADEEYWLQPLPPGLPGADPTQHVLYQFDDAILLGQTCGSELIPGNAPKFVGDAAAGGGAAGGFLGSQVAELGCDADYEYFLDYGSSTAASNRIQSVIGAMNQQYESEVGITHEITTILVRTSANQPYTSTDALTLLNQFRSEWNNNQGGIARDVAQLFTGKEINGGTIGIAWIGVVCNSSYGYGVVQSDFNNNTMCATDLSAHELGHNWNADHCNCTSYTMNPYITCANTFSPTQSRPEIINFRDSIGCLGDGGGGPGDPGDLFSDGFESGNFSAGGWSVLDNDARVAGNASRTGSYGARLRQVTWIERAVDTSGFASVTVEYSWRTRNMDTGEAVFAEWYNGSSWQTFDSWSSTGWDDASTVLPSGAGNNSAFRIRFRTNANRKNERGDVDDVRVIGG